MSSKYNFYDIVKVVSSKPALKKVNGKLGVIRGKSQSEVDFTIFAYAVDILNDVGMVKDGWFIFEEDLQPTGKKADPNDFQTGESVEIQVDPRTGKGYIPDTEL